MKSTQLQSKLDRLKGKRQELRKRLTDSQSKLVELEAKKLLLMKCNKLFSFLSTSNQDSIIKLFQNGISSGLQDMYDDSYEFQFLLKTRGDSSSCEFEIANGSHPGFSDIKLCNGKSVQEIVSIIFRIILVSLTKNRKVMVLDEPSGGVECDRQILLAKFLSDICRKFEIQLIVVTHSAEFAGASDHLLDLNKIRNLK